jgi:hypothetical protein
MQKGQKGAHLKRGRARLKRGLPEMGAGVAVICPALMIIEFSISFTVANLHDFWPVPVVWLPCLPCHIPHLFNTKQQF